MGTGTIFDSGVGLFSMNQMPVAMVAITDDF